MAELSETDKKSCMEAFDCFDLDCTGTLTFDEILHVVRSLGWEEDMASQGDIEKWFVGLGLDHKGAINKDQFLRAYGQSFFKDRRLAHLTKVFKGLDEDKSGTLSVDELYKGFVACNMTISKDDVKSLLTSMGSEVDANEGRQFNVKDFVGFFRMSQCFSENC